jgi:hypothetical protein
METFQGIWVAVIAILPGALYTWSYEREVGNWGAGFSDRVYRFIGFSAIFHAVFSFPEYLVWSHYLHASTEVGGSTQFRNLIAAGSTLPWWLFFLPIAYVGIPMLVGFLTAQSALRGGWMARILAGPSPPPRAWDALFWRKPSFLARAKLKDDTWVGGLFGEASYAAGYPEPQDLLLEETYEVLPDGSFASVGGAEDLVELGSRILLSWEDVRFLEISP